MADKLEIANMAIMMLGEEPLSSMEDGTKVADMADAFFDVCLETALSEHDWTFARKRTTLSSDTTVPAFGYSARFLLPSDYNHMVREMTDEEYEFREENGYILADQETIQLIYIANITNLNVLRPKFVDALASLLASYIAYGIKADSNTAERFRSLYEMKIQKAKGQDGSGVGIDEALDDWVGDR